MREFDRDSPLNGQGVTLGDPSSWAVLLVLLAVLSQGWTSTAALILPLLAVAGSWLALAGRLRLDDSPDLLEWSIGAWLLLWLISAGMALDRAHALSLSVPVLVFVLLFALCHRGSNDIRDTSIVALALLAVVQVTALLSAPVSAAPQARVLSAGSPWLLVPNDFVWSLCLWPVWWAWARSRSRLVRGLFVAMVVAQVVAACLLQSRLVWLGMVLAAAVCWSGWRGRRAWVAALLLALIPVVLLGIGKGLASVHARLQLWQAAWALWCNHPWLGVGPHGFGLVYRSIDVGPWVDPRQTPWPHQLLLELLANTGMLGAAAFLVVAALAWRTLRHDERAWSSGMASALVLFAAFSMLEASTLRLWWWVVLAVLLGGARSDQARTTA